MFKGTGQVGAARPLLRINPERLLWHTVKFFWAGACYIIHPHGYAVHIPALLLLQHIKTRLCAFAVPTLERSRQADTKVGVGFPPFPACRRSHAAPTCPMPNTLFNTPCCFSNSFFCIYFSIASLVGRKAGAVGKKGSCYRFAQAGSLNDRYGIINELYYRILNA